MATVHFYAMRLDANPEYPFLDFLLAQFGLHTESVLEFFTGSGANSAANPGAAGEAEADAPDGEVRVLWLGWLDQEERTIAGLLATPRKDKSYTRMAKNDAGESVISLAQLHEDAKELNFFLYSEPLGILLYQKGHSAIGPIGFFNLLRTRYNKAKNALKKEERASAKAREQKKITERFKPGLDFMFVAPKRRAEDLFAELKSGVVIFDIGISGVIDDGISPAFLRSRKLKLTLKGQVTEEGRKTLGRQVGALFERLNRPASVRGKRLDGQDLNFDLDNLMKKAAITEMEAEAWMALMDPEANEGQPLNIFGSSFPKDAKTSRLLPPIQRLCDILEEYASILQPDSERG